MDKPVVYADSLTVSELVTAPRDKRAIQRRYPVGIVNMEDYWAASVAQEAGVPFISARAILDPVRQTLPGYLSGIAGFRAKALMGRGGHAVADPHLGRPGPAIRDRPACPYRALL